MIWPLRLLLLPVMAVFHCFLIAGFVVACVCAIWQWLFNLKD